MSERTSKLRNVVIVVAIVTLVIWLGGRSLWGMLLAMHGKH